MDPIREITFRGDEPLTLQLARKYCPHTACPVAAGIIKAVEVESGLALPADATGSWTASADAYRNVTIDNHTDTGVSVREAAFNPTFTFAVTDAQPMART